MLYFTDYTPLAKDFPFDIYENSIPDSVSTLIDYVPRYPDQVLLHSHDFLEVNYVSSGEGTYYIGDETYHCKKGDILIFNNYEYHGGVAIKDFRLKVIVFDPNYIWTGDPLDYRYLKAFYERKADFLHHLSNNVLTEYITTIIFEIEHEWTRKEEGYKLIIKALLLKMLALLYRGFENSPQIAMQSTAFAKHYEKIAAALNHINDNFSTDITLSTLAEKCHMNPNYFSSYFKSVMNYTPFEYINKKRLDAACQRLLTTDDSITKIALDTGFHSISYFNRVFKSQMNISPQAFRGVRDKK